MSIFDVSTRGDALVIAPLRNISSLAEDEVQSQWEEILGLLRDGNVKNVIFDFHGISYFGSSMLEAMLVLWKRIRPGGGRMAVCNVGPDAREILRLSKFDTIWPVCSSLEEALQTTSTAV
jgi:anti-anti-sigma factor